MGRAVRGDQAAFLTIGSTEAGRIGWTDGMDWEAPGGWAHQDGKWTQQGRAVVVPCRLQ